MRDEDKIAERNHWRRATKLAEEDRAALVEKRERDPHSVDWHALSDISRRITELARKLRAAGGNPDRLDEVH